MRKRVPKWIKKIRKHAIFQTWKSSPKAPTVYEIGVKIPWPFWKKKNKSEGASESKESQVETREGRDTNPKK